MIKLVNMPFASPFQPSLALGTLKAILSRQGVDAEVFDFSVDMAALVGTGIAEKFGISNVQFGEWVFAPHAFPGMLGLTTPEEFIGLYGLSVPDDPKWPENRKFLFRFRDEIAPKFLVSCLEALLSDIPPAIAGFSCSYFQTMASIALARLLKQRRPDAITLFGGSDFHGGPGLEKIRKIPWIDAVSLGESDGSIHRICRFLLDSGHKPGPPQDSEGIIPGLAYRRTPGAKDIFHSPPAIASAEELRSSPVPDYGDFFSRAKFLGLEDDPSWRSKVTIPFEGSRGCWWGEKSHCRFCGLNGEGMAFRPKGGSQISDMLADLAGRHKVSQFYASDNNLPMAAFDDLIPKLIGRPPCEGARVFYSLKSNLKRRHLEMLARAGIVDIGPGIESLSTELLELMRKGVRGIDNVCFLKGCRNFSIRPRWNNLVRIPGESESAYEEMARTFRLVRHLHPPFATVEIQLYRYSPYFDEPGWVTNPRPAKFYDSLYPADTFDHEKIAYAFDGTWNATLPAEARRQAFEECERWRSRWDSRTLRVPCLEVTGPGSIRDTRHEAGETPRVLKFLRSAADSGNLGGVDFEVIEDGIFWRLSPEASVALAAFDDPGPVGRLAEVAGSRKESLLADCLEPLVTAGLLFREKELYLSLPTDPKGLLVEDCHANQNVES